MIEQFLQPRGFRQALRLKGRWGRDASAVVGGTDLMVRLRAGRTIPKIVIDLSRTGVSFIRRSKDWVRLGAAATAGDFLRLSWSKRQAPALWKACLQLGGPQVQNAATFAGNLANASPAADTPPVLMVMGAEIGIESLERGLRWVGIEEFLLGPGETLLEPDELIREIRIPRKALIPPTRRSSPGAGRDASGKSGGNGDRGRTVCDFYKMGPRRAQIISVACFAGWADLGPGEGRDVPLRALRLAAGGVAPKTSRLLAVEEFILGNGLSAETIPAAAERVSRDIAPISDVRGSAEYKALLTRNFARTFLESLLPAGGKESPR